MGDVPHYSGAGIGLPIYSSSTNPLPSFHFCFMQRILENGFDPTLLPHTKSLLTAYSCCDHSVSQQEDNRNGKP